jgi:hypothetical protein
MNKRNRLLSIGTIGCTALVFSGAPASAQSVAPSDDADARLTALKQRIDEQTRQLNALKQSLAEQEARSAGRTARRCGHGRRSATAGAGADPGRPGARRIDSPPRSRADLRATRGADA